MAGAARTAVDVWYSELGSLNEIPTDHTSLGLAAAASYHSKYVQSVEVGKAGVVRLTLTATQ